MPKDTPAVRYYAAGVAKADKKDPRKGLVTSGGRVACVTALAPTLEEAVREAYAHVDLIRFDNAFHRSDIGRRALKGE